MSTTTRAKAMRKETQDGIRERIKASGIVTNTLNNLKNMQELVEFMGDNANLGEINSKLNAYQIVNNAHAKLLTKILPDLKATEITGNLDLKTVVVDMTGVYDEAED